MTQVITLESRAKELFRFIRALPVQLQLTVAPDWYARVRLSHVPEDVPTIHVRVPDLAVRCYFHEVVDTFRHQAGYGLDA